MNSCSSDGGMAMVGTGGNGVVDTVASDLISIVAVLLGALTN